MRHLRHSRHRRQNADEINNSINDIMQNVTETLTNQNGEIYYKGICPFTDQVIYSFSPDFEDFWSQDDEDLYI